MAHAAEWAQAHSQQEDRHHAVVLFVEPLDEVLQLARGHLARSGVRILSATAAQQVPEGVQVAVASQVGAVRWVRDVLPGATVLAALVYPTPEEAVAAMRAGASDVVCVRGEPEPVVQRVQEAVRHRMEMDRRAASGGPWKFEGVVGSSPAMHEVLRVASIVAPTDATVLLTGESGTGKELVARSIHLQSRRASGPLVVLHCGAIPETLLETELFGHEKGAYTHAMGARPGKFEQAQGGTLFLDEVGDMSPRMQVKLLRVLQERVVERVGGTRPVAVDCRIVAATNRDLRRMVREGLFREDLFYRLNVVNLRVPALRERLEDLPALAEFFLDKYRRHVGKPVRGFTDGAMQKLLDHPWPGNVRELEAVVHRAVILTRGVWVQPEEVQLDVFPHRSAR
jgi:two-component system response regulator HydG